METIKKFVPLNFQMMAHPVNWIIVFLMVAIVGLAVSLMFTKPATAE